MRAKKDLKKFIVFVIIGILLLSTFTTVTGQYQQLNVKNPNQIILDTQSFGNPTVGYANYDLDPAQDYETQGIGFINLVYEGLVTYDTNNPNMVVGQLANNWTVSHNGTVYTFNLKHNIKYQDGTPFNAWTMKYSFDRMLIADSGASFLLAQQIFGASPLNVWAVNISDIPKYLDAGGISVINDYTLQIKLLHPFQPFIKLLAFCPKAVSPAFIINHLPTNYTTNQSDPIYGMISLHDEFPTLTDWTKLGLESNHNPAISGIVPNAWRGRPSYNTWIGSHMSGTGPYKLFNDSTSEISFIRNVDWAGTFAPNSPNQLTWRLVPDANNRILDFLNGQTDTFRVGAISNNQLFSLINSSGQSIIKDVTAYQIPQVSDRRLSFNFNESLTRFVVPANNITTTWNETHIIDDNLVEYSTNNTQFASLGNPFTALKFREAFANAFDYDTLIMQMGNGIFEKRLIGIIPSSLDGHVDGLIEQHIIPIFNTTQAIKLFNEVGWRGNITLVVNGLGGLNNDYITDKILQTGINSLDVGITINVVNKSTIQTPISPDNSPLAIEPWAADYDSAYDFIYPLIDSEGYFPIAYTHYSNPVIDQLINKSATDSDYTTRINDYKNIVLTSAKDYESIYLSEPIGILLVHNWIHNFNSSGSFNPFAIYPNFQFISKGNTISSTISTQSDSTSNVPDFLVNQVVLVLMVISIKLKKKR